MPHISKSRIDGAIFTEPLIMAGHLVDVMLSDIRNQAAAERFLSQREKTTSVTPVQVTTDKEAALYPAMETVFPETFHRDVKFKNNSIEAGHRGIKSRYKVMKGFKNPFSALCFCTVFDELRQHFRMKNKTRPERRGLLPSKIQQFAKIFMAS